MSKTATPSLRAGSGRSLVPIGALEAEVLAAIWERDEAAVTVRDIYECLRQQHQIAYTTVMSVMGNLADKHLLVCDRSAIAYRYRAAIPGDQVAGEAIDSVVGRLYRNRLEVAVSHLLGLDGQLSATQLEALRQEAQKLLESS